MSCLSRRQFLGAGLGFAAAPVLARQVPAEVARVVISLDLEMSRHYPTRGQMRWDFEKGNLDEPTKRYALEAARRVRERGGHIHFFAVGRVLEQENVGWLREIHETGHPVGNHTYDHVNVKAASMDQVQFRFQRAPWLVEGKSPEQVIRDNVAITTKALKQRLGIVPSGFRTPGGFNDGLKDRPDIQRMLLDQGFRWVSSLYPSHPLGKEGEIPADEVIGGIVKAQLDAQPFAYPSGLIELPMSPVSDVTALRSGRWPLESFLLALRKSLEFVIDRSLVYDFLAHPSCLVVEDPKFRAIDLICDMVEASRGRARLSVLGDIAEWMTARAKTFETNAKPGQSLRESDR